MTMGIRKSSKRKSKLYEKMIDGMVSQEYYKEYSRVLKRVIEQAEINSKNAYIEKSENKTKATWTQSIMLQKI